MRTVLTSLVTALVVCLVVPQVPRAEARPDDATVRAGRVVLVDEDGAERVTLRAARSGSGVWVTGADGEVASMFAAPGQGVAVGVWSADRTQAAALPDLAVAAQKSATFVQSTGRDGRAVCRAAVDLLK